MINEMLPFSHEFMYMLLIDKDFCTTETFFVLGHSDTHLFLIKSETGREKGQMVLKLLLGDYKICEAFVLCLMLMYFLCFVFFFS